MATPACQVYIKKFMTNRLLNRRQFLVDVVHPGRANVPKTELRERIAKQYKCGDDKQVVLYGFRTAFGGGRSRGFGLLYDNMASMQKFEPKYRLIRLGLAEKESRPGRKQIKEKKNRAKKARGLKKAKILEVKK